MVDVYINRRSDVSSNLRSSLGVVTCLLTWKKEKRWGEGRGGFVCRLSCFDCWSCLILPNDHLRGVTDGLIVLWMLRRCILDYCCEYNHSVMRVSKGVGKLVDC